MPIDDEKLDVIFRAVMAERVADLQARAKWGVGWWRPEHPAHHSTCWFIAGALLIQVQMLTGEDITPEQAVEFVRRALPVWGREHEERLTRTS